MLVDSHGDEGKVDAEEEKRRQSNIVERDMWHKSYK